MSLGWCVMVPAEDLSFERFIRWYYYFPVSRVQSFLVLSDFFGLPPILYQGAMATLGFFQVLEETFPRDVRCPYKDLRREER